MCDQRHERILPCPSALSATAGTFPLEHRGPSGGCLSGSFGRRRWRRLSPEELARRHALIPNPSAAGADLFEAVESDDIARVRELLAGGADINAPILAHRCTTARRH